MVSILVQVTGTETEVYQRYFRQTLQRTVLVSHKDIVKLEIVVDLADLVQVLEQVDHIDANLTHSFETEGFFTFVEVVQQRLPQRLHHNKRVAGRRIILHLIVIRGHLLLLLLVVITHNKLSSAKKFRKMVGNRMGWLESFVESP